MKEADIEKKVSLYAKNLGWLCFKFVSPSHRGVPDRIYFKRGKTLLIEFKALGKVPTLLQSSIIQKLLDENIPTFVIDNVEDGKKLFKLY